MALVFSLFLLPVAAQYSEDPGSKFPTPTVESNCLQDNLADNQVYYQKVDQMFNGSSNAICPNTLGLYVNQPCTWAAGRATMTVAPVINQCHWAIRNFHWHDSSDEWSYMVQGVMQVYLTSPSGVPWQSAVNTIGAGGVWFFPRGWPHAFVCVSEEGCNYVLTFNGPQSVAVNDHMIAESYAQLPDKIAAYSMGMSMGEWATAKPKMSADTGTFFAKVDSAKFKWLPEENAEPAAVNRSDVEVEDTRPGLGKGIQVWNIRTAQFPFATRMSQQRIVFQPGGFRSLVWITNAAAIMTVISGHVNAATQGGISGGNNTGPSSTSYEATNLGPFDAFYFPIRRGYWIEEATGKEPAEVIVVFEVGNWEALEAKDGFSCANPLGAPWAYEATAGGIECPSTAELVQRDGKRHKSLRRHDNSDTQSLMQQPKQTEIENSEL
ncbi:unnamed protein product [Durusdinium trenchii]|uniref:Cupin type-1 domain-containing protein n=2 Tax=Durusdinium trenchii TaxID=1381693 RepID=A0ABP0LCR9_9DINO